MHIGTKSNQKTAGPDYINVMISKKRVEQTNLLEQIATLNQWNPGASWICESSKNILHIKIPVIGGLWWGKILEEKLGGWSWFTE